MADTIDRLINTSLPIVAQQAGRKGFTAHDLLERIKLMDGGHGAALGVRLGRLKKGPDERYWSFSSRLERSILDNCYAAIRAARLSLHKDLSIRLYPRIDVKRYGLVSMLYPAKQLLFQITTNEKMERANARQAELLRLIIDKAAAYGPRATVADVLPDVVAALR